MPITPLVYPVILASVLLGSTGQVLFKVGLRHGFLWQSLVSAPILLGFASYAASSLLWLYALARLPLGLAYPFLSLNFILVLLASHWVLREPLTRGQILGTALIIGGVALIAR